MLPAEQIETGLRKMEGIKEVRINHVSHTVKIRYDPSIVTIEKIRTVLKGIGSGVSRFELDRGRGFLRKARG